MIFLAFKIVPNYMFQMNDVCVLSMTINLLKYSLKMKILLLKIILIHYSIINICINTKYYSIII